ncbi:GNAT family N-acetyltransferase [Streptomyces sp. NPDC000070]|uniref:GNAT family N-acetyltransferase n=1 Tax=Streptomyces sp. NPDC000070 TaxID=3154240 RepID=UPI003325E2AA
MNIRMRDMRREDVDSVLELDRDLFPDDLTWSGAELGSELAAAHSPDGERRFLVVGEEPSGRVVAYAHCIAAAGTCNVVVFGVARDRWRTSVGTQLGAEIIRRATLYGCREVLADVRVDNTPILRGTGGVGGKPIGFRPGFYQPDNVDSVVVRLGLPGRLPRLREELYYDLRRVVRYLRLRHRYGSRLRADVEARMGLRDTAGTGPRRKAPARREIGVK